MNYNIKKLILLITIIFIVSICATSAISAKEIDSTNETIKLETSPQQGITDESTDDIEMDDVYVNQNAENNGNGSEDNPFKTINEAVDYGNNNQNPVIIHIHPGTYAETNMTITNNMIIKSHDGEVILNGNGQGWFFYSNNSNNNLTLIGLTFKNGINYDYYDSTIGGVVKTEGHIDVVNCTFENNFGGTGGGINSHNGANIINSTFMNNRAEYNGAGIYNIYGQTNIINCTFHNNTAKRQGGAVRIQGNTYIENSTFTDNYAGTGNYAGNGGAVRVTDGDLNIESSTFRNNSAKFEGGAVSAGDDNQYSMTHYQLNINNSTFVDNKARTGAGIIANDGINLTNSVLSNNSVPYSISAKYGTGAGLYVLNGNSILVGNTIENNTNPYNKWDSEDIFSYQGNVAAEGNNWGQDSNPRIKTNNGKTTNEVTVQPKINKPTVTIQTGEKKKKEETIIPIEDDNTNSNTPNTPNTPHIPISDNIKTSEPPQNTKNTAENGVTQITNEMTGNANNRNSKNTIRTNSTTTESQNTDANLGENNEPSNTESGSNGKQSQESPVAHELSPIKTVTQDNILQSIGLILIVSLALIIGYKVKEREK